MSWLPVVLASVPKNHVATICSAVSLIETIKALICAPLLQNVLAAGFAYEDWRMGCVFYVATVSALNYFRLGFIANFGRFCMWSHLLLLLLSSELLLRTECISASPQRQRMIREGSRRGKRKINTWVASVSIFQNILNKT